jgi:amino acid transporter
MPEESINIFISNIYAIAVFTGVFIILFIFLFILSRIFILRSKKHTKHLKSAGDSAPGPTPSLLTLNKDINILKNLFIAGLIFVLSIFFIILILLSFYVANNFKMDSSLYMIIAIVFLILAIAVYVVKSRIAER